MTTYANVGHILLKRGNTIQSSNYTGPLGELTINTDTKQIQVHDNTTRGGFANLATQAYVTATIGNIGGGGTTGPVQPYLQLTNESLIVQPVVLGTPVTITAAATGNGAVFQVDILEGPVLGGITVTTPGSGYTVGQSYIIYGYQIGGSNDLTDSITLTIGTVDGNGGILTVANVQFVGVPGNTPSSQGGVSIELRASVFDEIDTGLTLTRAYQQGIYNSELESEYNDINDLSPLGTEWNSEGWGDLTDLGTRSYTTWRQALNNQVGNLILGAELVMHDIANDRYYKFDFTQWGGSNGGYAYTRTEVTDPNYFRKPHDADAGDVIKADEPAGTGIVIVRTDSTGIWNFFQEEGYTNANSPLGTTWNADGWDDLSDLTTRTYTSFYLATGQNINDVLGKKFVMYVAALQKYYAIQFYEWATNGNNNFAYVRYEIDQTKLNEGIKFSDGTLLKSAEGVGRVKSTAAGNRRIEEVTGFGQVAVTARVTTNLTATATRSYTGVYEIWIDSATTTIDDIISNPANYNNAYDFEFSLDQITWYVWTGGSGIDGTERIYSVGTPVTYLQGDTVYFRYKSGGAPVVWWDKNDLPGSGTDFRGAIIDYHAYTGESTIIGTIHIVDDSGEEHISHQEVQSGSTDGDNDDLWLVQTEGTVSYRRIDGESKTLKIHWTAKVFYGSEFWD